MRFDKGTTARAPHALSPFNTLYTECARPHIRVCDINVASNCLLLSVHIVRLAENAPGSPSSPCSDVNASIISYSHPLAHAATEYCLSLGSNGTYVILMSSTLAPYTRPVPLYWYSITARMNQITRCHNTDIFHYWLTFGTYTPFI